MADDASVRVTVALAVLLDHEIPLHQLGAGHHLLRQQEVVVLGGKISRHLSSWDANKRCLWSENLFERMYKTPTLDTGIF